MTAALLAAALALFPAPAPPDPVAARLVLLPSADVALEYSTFAAAHAEWAETQAALYPGQHDGYAIYARHCADCWQALAGAHGRDQVDGESGPTAPPDEQLDYLELLLPPRYVAFGWMPPPSPCWRGDWAGMPAGHAP